MVRHQVSSESDAPQPLQCAPSSGHNAQAGVRTASTTSQGSPGFHSLIGHDQPVALLIKPIEDDPGVDAQPVVVATLQVVTSRSSRSSWSFGFGDSAHFVPPSLSTRKSPLMKNRSLYIENLVRPHLKVCSGPLE